MSTYLDSGEPSAGGNNVLVYEFKISQRGEHDLIANMVIADWLEHNRIGRWILSNKIPLSTRIVTKQTALINPKFSMYHPVIEVYATLSESQQVEYFLIR